MRNFDVIIIGSGASGVLCALKASEKKLNIALIDSNFFPCKKLNVTGNGRCNFTNNNMNSKFFNQNIDKFLTRFSNTNIVDYFSKIGLISYFDDEGRYYPFSNSSKNIVEILNYQLIKSGVEIFDNKKVIGCNRNQDKFLVQLEDDEIFECNKLVLATGGKSLEYLGQNFPELKIKNCVPSLVSLKTKEQTKSLEGTRLSNVLVTATCGNNMMSEVGEVLFKDHGLSGIVIFNISSLYARNTRFEGKISIDLMPDFTETKIIDLLCLMKDKFDNAKDILMGLFQNSVSQEILKRSFISLFKKAKDISIFEIKKIVQIIKHFDFEIVDCYDNNQVFSGGVLLNSLTDNLESKNIKNLYCCGECCDVDGVCGGYNLQWAWTSGYIVGSAL